jgi:hypothetical protein
MFFTKIKSFKKIKLVAAFNHTPQSMLNWFLVFSFGGRREWSLENKLSFKHDIFVL